MPTCPSHAHAHPDAPRHWLRLHPLHHLGLAAALLAGLVGLTGCQPRAASPNTSPSSTTTTESTITAVTAPASSKIIVQLDWVPEPEHGGFFQAQGRGWFKEAGLDVEILPGGPNTLVGQRVATRQAHIGQADSTNTLLARQNGLPLLQVAAVFQNEPSVLMLHAENPITDFRQLDGKKLMARPEWAFLPYLKKKYSIDFTLIPFNFSVTNFIADKNFIQQGYYIAEPFFITSGGAPAPKFLYSWDAGFDAYSVLVVNEAWARENAPALRSFLAVYLRGWRDYLEGDPAPAHQLMKELNSKNSDAFLDFARGMIIQEKLVVGRQSTDSSQIGRLDPARYATQIRQLEELAILKPGSLTVPAVMTTEYLPAPLPVAAPAVVPAP